MANGWSWQQQPELNLIQVTFQDPFSLNDVDTAAQTLESEGHLSQHRLLNFVECNELSPTTTELLDIARRSADWQLEGIKVAWLAGTQAAAGLLRIIASKFDEKTMKVFTSEAEAKRWLQGTKEIVQDSPGRVEHLPIRMRGQINLDEVLKTQKAVRSAKDYSPELPLLWDLRESQLSESLAEVKDLAVHLAANHNRDRAGRKSAVLVDSHIMDLLIREMAKVDDWPREDVTVFKSYRDAVAWLALD